MRRSRYALSHSANFPETASTTVTVLAGDGSATQGTAHVDRAATEANLDVTSSWSVVFPP
jgi:hypothetical protein